MFKYRFYLTEVICFLYGRCPRNRNRTPQFRIQNFLLKVPDWRTSTERSAHIGERGELDTLRAILGPERMQIIHDVEQAWVKELSGGAQIFPTPKSFRLFIAELRKKLGAKIVLEVQ
jgi:hypothetical protein